MKSSVCRKGFPQPHGELLLRKGEQLPKGSPQERSEDQMPGHFLNLTIPVTTLLLGFGIFLILDSVSNTKTSQLPEVIAGALLLALGLLLLPRELRLVYRWMQSTRAHDDGPL